MVTINSFELGKLRRSAATRAVGDQWFKVEELRDKADYEFRPGPSDDNWQHDWSVARSLASFILPGVR